MGTKINCNYGRANDNGSWDAFVRPSCPPLQGCGWIGDGSMKQEREDRKMRLAYLGVLIVGTTLLAQKPAPEPQTISICDLFKDLRSYAGKMISVRGMLSLSGEVFALGGECADKFTTKYSSTPTVPGLSSIDSEFTWPTALDLVTTVLVEKGEKVTGFQTDDTLASIITRIRIEQARSGSQNIRVAATVLGELRLKDHYEVGRGGDGRLHGGGYGHLSAFPGQILIKSLKDVEIKRN